MVPYTLVPRVVFPQGFDEIDRKLYGLEFNVFDRFRDDGVLLYIVDDDRDFLERCLATTTAQYKGPDRLGVGVSLAVEEAPAEAD